MNIEVKTNIVEKISETGKCGIGLISLSNDINVPLSRLRRFVQANTDYFCRVGENSKYVINRTGRFKGSKEEIISDLMSKEARSKNIEFYSYILIAFCIGYTLGNL